MVEAVSMVREGTAPRVAQDEDQATYEGWCRAEDVVIDWDRPVGKIYDPVRGADPSPGAGTLLDGKGVRFYRAQKREGDEGRAPGEVVEITDEGFRVGAADGSLLIGRVQPEGERKVAASEWAESVGLSPGMRFGSLS